MERRIMKRNIILSVLLCLAAVFLASCDAGGVRPLERIILNTAEITIEKGQTFQLSASLQPEDADDVSLVWASDNEKYVSVDQNGLVTGLSPTPETMSVMVRVYCENYHRVAYCVVTVTEAVLDSVTLDRTEAVMRVGDELQLNATLLPSYITEVDVQWSSSNPACVSVDEDGLVRALAYSSNPVRITAKAGKYSAECIITLDSGIETLPTDSLHIPQWAWGDYWTMQAGMELYVHISESSLSLHSPSVITHFGSVLEHYGITSQWQSDSAWSVTSSIEGEVSTVGLIKGKEGSLHFGDVVLEPLREGESIPELNADAELIDAGTEGGVSVPQWAWGTYTAEFPFEVVRTGEEHIYSLTADISGSGWSVGVVDESGNTVREYGPIVGEDEILVSQQTGDGAEIYVLEYGFNRWFPNQVAVYKFGRYPAIHVKYVVTSNDSPLAVIMETGVFAVSLIPSQQ